MKDFHKRLFYLCGTDSLTILKAIILDLINNKKKKKKKRKKEKKKKKI